MRSLRRLLTLLVFTIPLVAIAMFGYFAVRRYLTRASQGIGPLLAQAATAALGHEVRIGSARVRGGHLVLADVAVAAGRTLAESGPIATARRVEVDLDLVNLLLERDQAVPIFGAARAEGLWAHVARDAAGRWNFADLIRPPRKPEGRPIVGRLTLADSTIVYNDAAAPHGRGRTPRPLHMTLTGVAGHIDTYRDRGLSWHVNMGSASRLFDSMEAQGTYDTQARAIALTVWATNVALASAVPRFLPADLDVTAGRASGRLTVLTRPDAQGLAAVGLWGEAAVRDASLASTRLARPLRQINATFTLVGDTLAGQAAGTLAGATVVVDGRAIGLTRTRVDARVRVAAPAIAPLIAAAGMTTRARELGLEGVRGSLTARGTVRGTLTDPAFQLAGRVSASGSARGARTGAEPGDFRVAAAGTLAHPRVAVAGTLPLVRFRDYRVTAIRLSGEYAERRAALDVRASIAGGAINARVDVALGPGPIRYSAAARLRGVRLARIPDLVTRLPRNAKVAGIASVDVDAQGTTGSTLPSGRMTVRVSSLNLNDMAFDGLSASLSSDGRVVRVEPLLLRAGSAVAIARGTIDVAARTLALRGTARGIHLADLPIKLDAAPDQPLTGVLFVRRFEARGPWSRPRITARAQTFGAGLGKFQVDVATIAITGTTEALSVQADAQRLPATLELTGMVRRPLSGQASVALSGSFEHLEVQDAARMAGNEATVTGTASGQIEVTGTLPNVRIAADPIQVDRPGFGDVILDRMTAVVTYALADHTLRVRDLIARLDQATLTGTASLERSGGLHASFEANDVPLSLLENPYTHLTGTAAAHGTLDGTLAEGKVAGLSGTIVVSVSDLTVAEEPLGDMRARVEVNDGRWRAAAATPDEPPIRIGTDQRYVALDEALYDQERNAVSVEGRVRNFSLDVLQQIAVRSPALAGRPDSIVTQWLSPAINPLSGSLDARFGVSGLATEPRASFEWQAVDMEVGGQPIRRFRGSVKADAGRIALEEATLEAEDLSIGASGTLVVDESLRGEVQVNNLTMDLLRRWFPGRAILARIGGTVDNAVVRAVGGTPSSPDLTVTAELRNVAIRAGEVASPTAPPAVQFDAVRLAAGIAGNRLYVEDLAVGLSKPPAPGETGPPERYEAHASGETRFAWGPPYVADDAPIRLEAHLPEQSLDLFNALLPGIDIDLDGRIRADMAYQGTLAELRRADQEIASGAAPPNVTGTVVVTANRIRYDRMSTVLDDVDATLELAGDRLRIGRNPLTGKEFSARVDVIDPRTGAAVVKGSPLVVRGSLPLRPGVAGGEPLTITAQRIVFAEAPLPVFGTGRAVGELAGAAEAEPGLALTVTGDVARPHIAGDIRVRRTDFKMPEVVAEAVGGPVALPVLPSFDLAIRLGERVRVSAAMMTVSVSSAEGAPVEIGGTIESPSINGTLTVDGGTLAFPTARFTIASGGTVTVRYPAYTEVHLTDPTLAILVNVTAQTRLTATSVNGVRKRYTITVEAQGPINSEAPVSILGSDDTPGAGAGRGLRLTFRSDPPDLALTSAGLQRRVTGLLGGQAAIESLFSRQGNVGRALAEQFTEILSAGLLPGLLDQLGIGRALGFSEFALEYNTFEQFTLRVSRPLFGPFEVTYWRRLSGARLAGSSVPAAWELKLSYRVRSHIQLSYTIDDQRTNEYRVEGVFRF
ncbi:MAG: translocation/assembly module TamB domain-containing protein [Chthonomonadales bacterium]|nr:translocation/assembly module TamB domain-containing protein [Chthonomonadales bacterium]